MCTSVVETDLEINVFWRGCANVLMMGTLGHLKSTNRGIAFLGFRLPEWDEERNG
jgi:hypothetical protein